MATPITETVYWITGAGSGIGLALARTLARAGITVIASGRRLEPLLALQQECPERIIALPVDVSDAQAMEALFSHPAVAHITALDGVILAAGACEYVDLPELDPALFERILQVNFMGVVLASRAALPLLKKSARPQGKAPVLVGVSSMSTYTGFPRAEAYGASKAAMAYFLNSLRCDVAPEIAVCVIYPGFVATPMSQSNDFPMPFMITAEEAAHTILHKLQRRPHSIVLPLRLHVVLRLAGWLSPLWYGFVVPRLTRKRTETL